MPDADILEAIDAESERVPLSLLEALREPISAEHPCGENVRYDDDFQALKAQIDHLESATGTVDDDQIIELGCKILTRKSKDLTAACYLALGLTRQRGITGLAEGLAATVLLVESFWADCFPAAHRVAARRNALQFLADRLKAWLADYEPSEADRSSLRRAQRDLAALQAFCAKQMGDHVPVFSGLDNALKNAVQGLPEAKVDTPDEAAPEELSPVETPAAPGEVHSATEARQAIMRGITFLRGREGASDPMPYRLIRAMRWGALQHEPPSERGRTRIGPPREERRTYLRDLAEQGEYETLVEETEASFRNPPFHFWLDLQRLLAGALDALGDPYVPVREAVLIETVLLVRRLPGLPALAFSDGTPFAGPLTQEWLQTQQHALFGEQGKHKTKDETDEAREHPALDERYREAQQLLSAGDLQGALAEIQQGRRQDSTPKEGFRRRLYAADLCLKGNRPDVARPLLERLSADVRRHALDAWDPALALTVWSRLHTCLSALERAAPQPRKQALRERSEEVFAQICRVDAAHALSVAGGNKTR